MIIDLGDICDYNLTTYRHIIGYKCTQCNVIILNNNVLITTLLFGIQYTTQIYISTIYLKVSFVKRFLFVNQCCSITNPLTIIYSFYLQNTSRIKRVVIPCLSAGDISDKRCSDIDQLISSSMIRQYYTTHFTKWLLF